MKNHNAKRPSVNPEHRVQAGPRKNNDMTVKHIASTKKVRRKMTKKQLIQRIGIAIVAFVALIAITAGLIWNYIFSGLKTQSSSESGLYPTEALTYQPPEVKGITNILLLGVDSLTPNKAQGLSDSIIILTVDTEHNVLKMTSIMRDCYVYIPGHKKPMKINEANNLGGPELAVSTINSTLRLNISKYIVVNFQTMANIIDIAGGVTLKVTEKERKELNIMFTDARMDKSVLLSSAGTYKFTGAQAVLFARIRHIDSDSERTRRQRDVLSALYLGFKQASLTAKASMIQQGLSELTTNMTATEITDLGMKVLPTMANEIQQLRLPIDGYYTVNSSGIWYMNVDYNRMIPEVYKFIYGETYPFDAVPTIPFEPNVTKAPASSGTGQSSASLSSEASSSLNESSEDSMDSSSASGSPSSSESASSSLSPTPTEPASSASPSSSS